MIILVLGLFLMPYTTALGMDNGAQYWIYWSHETKSYERRTVSQHSRQQRAELDNKLRRIDQERKYRETLVNPCAMQTIVQQANLGCPIAQHMVVDAVALPENQYNTLRYQMWCSINEHQKQDYARAFAYLRNVRRLLVSASQATKYMLMNDKNIIEEYRLYLEIDINLTSYLAKNTDDSSYERSMESRNHYIKLFNAILKSIHVSKGRAANV